MEAELAVQLGACLFVDEASRLPPRMRGASASTPPAGGAAEPEDGALSVWEEAVRYQTAGLLVSQGLLFGVGALKVSPATSALSLLALALVWVRTAQLEAAHVPLAKHMPMQRCAQLDATAPGATTLRAYCER